MMRASLMQRLSQAKPLFDPRQHLWLRTTTATKANQDTLSTLLSQTQTSDTTVGNTTDENQILWINIGLTQRGLDDIGDVVAWRMSHDVIAARPVAARQPVLTLDWEAHTITSADELYHTVWHTVEEHTSLHAPLSGFVLASPSFCPDREALDQETVLFQMAVDTVEHEHENETTLLLDEQDYQNHVDSLEPGKFQSPAA